MNFFIRLTFLCSFFLSSLSNSTSFKEITLNPCSSDQCSVSPRIDGDIKTGEWKSAVAFGDLVQVRPIELDNPSEKTTILVMVSNSTLFIAAKLFYEKTENIVAKVSRQGANVSNDDFIRIQLDPFNSKKAGYRFQVNMNGVRNEGIFLNITSVNEDWTAIWEAQAKKTSYGWSAEMAIPLKSLSFDSDINTWGFNVFRYISKKNELISWVSKNQESNISVSGSLIGIEGVDEGTGLDIVPNISYQSFKNTQTGDSDQRFQPSLDIFYKVTPSLNGALTFNTDFSATEVDDRRVDLSQFSLFFPEKRAFFLREFDIFDFGGIGGDFSYSRFGGSQSQNARPFFSRKIGLGRDGAPVDIIGGAKLSGRLNGYDLGFLIVEQDNYADINQKDLMIGRVSKNIHQNATLGLIHTSGNPRSNEDNSLTGIDFRYRDSSRRNQIFEANMWYQKSSTPNIKEGQEAFGLSLSMPNPNGYRALIQYQSVGENFNPALGFVSRRGVQLRRGVLGYIKQLKNNSLIRKIYSGADVAHWRFEESGRLQSSTEFYRLIDVESNTGDKFNISYVRFGEGIYEDINQPFADLGIILPKQEYSWDRYGIYIRTSKSRPVDFKMNYYSGDYYTGRRDSGSIDIGFRPTPEIDLSVDYNYWDVELPEGEFVLRQIDTKFSWSFLQNFSWVTVIQYDNISKNLGFNSRIHWTKRAGENVYVVFTNNYLELDENNSKDFKLLTRDASIKVNYTIRF